MGVAAATLVKDQEEMFHGAASQGMLSAVIKILKDGKLSRDMPDRFGRTPLHWAAEQGRRNVVLALLRAGARVDPLSQCENTPLMLAAYRGHVEVVGVLLHYRAGESDCLPLSRHRSGVDHWRSTALHCAAAGGHLRTVEILLGAGFDRGQKDKRGVTPVEVSARKSNPTAAAITRLLLPVSDKGGELVYEYVDTQMQDVAIVSGLVKGGAFLDWQDKNGQSPLHRAVHFRHAIISRILLQAGADPDLRDNRSASPLHVAACTGYGEIVAELLEVGADMELLMKRGQSPLHMAVGNNRLNVVRLLLNAEASTEHRDDIHGLTPLSLACRFCLSPIVRILVEAGADVESTSAAGITPLQCACRLIDAESVEALLDAGADPGAVDQAAAALGVTALPSRNTTAVSLPVAIDVIGLGYPPDLMKDSMRSFTGGPVRLGVRRLDVVSIKRIKSALQAATLKRSIHLRGLAGHA